MNNVIVLAGLLLVLLGLAIMVLFWQQVDTPKPGNKTILMMGRSTMTLWFKHWNWPPLLRWKTTYRPWPLPWDTKVFDGFNLFFSPLANPGSPGPGQDWGDPTVESLKKAVDSRSPDAVFFKFCFVDFQVNSENRRQRFTDLKRSFAEVFSYCQERDIKLLLGNALPLARPNPDAVILQREFNQWLEEYAAVKEDVYVFELFEPFINPDGALRREFWKAADDHHFNDKAYNILDANLFYEALPWLQSVTTPHQQADVN
jgi:hypothetical protein